MERLAFGVRSLDRLLGGGIEAGSLTELYGEGGTGKTNLCLLLAAEVARVGRWTIYLDTEGMSLDRLSQIATGVGTTLQSVLNRVYLANPQTLEEQEKSVERAVSLARQKETEIGLIVLDSCTLLYRLALGQEDEDIARQSLSAQLALLLHASLETGVPVIFTNQVWRDVSTSAFEPIGGSFLNHIAKTILRIDRGHDGWRRATLMKHRSLPEGGTADFQLTSEGIRSP